MSTQAVTSLDVYTGPESAPGVEISDDNEEALSEYVRRTLGSIGDYSSTCSMMAEDLAGVVDERLRVYGIRGLRVVDASVIPLIVGGHLQATVYAVAENAADMIKQDNLGK